MLVLDLPEAAAANLQILVTAGLTVTDSQSVDYYSVGIRFGFTAGDL